VLNISDLCFVNYEYMFKNSSLKLEKQHFHNVSVYNRYLHKLFNQLIENIQYVNYRIYRDSIAIVKSTIDSIS